MKNISLVTIYIPTFNRVELLKRAVNSVLTQTHKNIELIIVNDASTDDTESYLESLVKKDSRVRYFTNKESKKACYSRNLAINNATGEFITGLDDDDYFESNRIERFLSDWNNKAMALYSYSIESECSNKKLIKRPSKISQKNLLICNYPGNQIFTKTKYLREINGFDEMLPAWQDLDTWYRILAKPNSFMDLSMHSSYIIDVSHDSPRISEDLSRIDIAYKIFCEKHRLQEHQSSLVNLQRLAYYGEIKTKDYLLAIFSSRSVELFIIFTKQKLRKLLSIV